MKKCEADATTKGRGSADLGERSTVPIRGHIAKRSISYLQARHLLCVPLMCHTRLIGSLLLAVSLMLSAHAAKAADAPLPLEKVRKFGGDAFAGRYDFARKRAARVSASAAAILDDVVRNAMKSSHDKPQSASSHYAALDSVVKVDRTGNKATHLELLDVGKTDRMESVIQESRSGHKDGSHQVVTVSRGLFPKVELSDGSSWESRGTFLSPMLNPVRSERRLLPGVRLVRERKPGTRPGDREMSTRLVFGNGE